MGKDNNKARQHNRQIAPFGGMMLAVLLFAGIILFPATASASAVPGGNISNPIVKAVDIAKPAIVRIITTLDGRLTVYFSEDEAGVTFPRDGGSYELQLSGSGSFISSHGDILTATHVIKPPKDDSMDDYLKMIAAKDVAEYFNDHYKPRVEYSESEMYSYLAYGIFRSEARYEQPTSEVYLSKDFIGNQTASTMKELPTETHIRVDTVKASSAVEDKDTAIIHVNLEDTPSIQLGNSQEVAQQDELTIIGFPGNGDLEEPGKTNPNNYLTASVNKIYVSAIKTTSKGAPVIQVGGNVEHGDSGGPAIDRNGNVVGVVSFVNMVSQPSGTSFLQASESAKKLLANLNLDLKPGKFQKAWTQAFAHYTSTEDGHWTKAYEGFKKIEQNYPRFKGVTPFLNYTKIQAQKDTVSVGQTNWVAITIISLLALLVLAAILFGAIWFILRARAKKQTGTQQMPVGANGVAPHNQYQQPYGVAQPYTNPAAYMANPNQPVQYGVQHPQVPFSHPANGYNTPAVPLTPQPQQIVQTPQPQAPVHNPQAPEFTHAWQEQSAAVPTTPVVKNDAEATQIAQSEFVEQPTQRATNNGVPESPSIEDATTYSAPAPIMHEEVQDNDHTQGDTQKLRALKRVNGVFNSEEPLAIEQKPVQAEAHTESENKTYSGHLS